jgi:hypothetical protein
MRRLFRKASNVFAVLTSIEMAAAVLVYLPVVCLTNRRAKKSFVTITFLFFTFFTLM